ncbi:xylulokinase [Egicoccus halophilus]|uniref:Xylulose kinase n=1 Tax=Egicoccus halophilus TaxID=1670830 RepID=A0A8J3AEM6_9ACTN|nr:xylulokinase [Egicoccus halophilus]GGI07147.1 xylulokinase [Egicoccus halophilus]
MALVAGVDSSTQSCKVVLRDADTGELVRSGRAAHPDGTEVAPAHWWQALTAAVEDAGGLDDVEAIAVGGQQHGMVALDEDGEVVRDALLWNDTRSAAAALELIAELGEGDASAGAAVWANAVGIVPVASFTVTKLRWLAEHEPEHAARVAAVALPHDWLTWRLAGASSLESLTTDRSDASGTGYWSPHTGDYRRDLLTRGLGHDAVLPRVVGPAERAGTGAAGVVPGLGADVALGPGAGDNAAAALGLGLRPGEVAVSIGTSGVVSAIATAPTSDASGLVAGFADATGHFLPLVCTLNASRVLDAACRLLGVDHAELSRLALSAPLGADGLVLVPYLEGERTPNRPDDTGALHGLRPDNLTPANLARAAVEGLLCGLADGLDELRANGVQVERLHLIGGGARSEALQRIAPALFGVDVEVPPAGEYVADGAARQAAWVLAGGDTPPDWGGARGAPVAHAADEDGAFVRERYAAVRELTATAWGRR